MGDDSLAIREILETFRKDTTKNRQFLRTAVTTKNTTEISSIAHRMLPMFRQLQIQRAIPILEKFEKITIDYNNWKKLKADFTKLDLFLDELLIVLDKVTATPLVYSD